jgi:DNA-binding MarR family transcriptional regulator
LPRYNIRMARRRVRQAAAAHRAPSPSAAWLLAQIGGHAAVKFADRLAPLKLAPPHAGILRALASSGGSSQQSLATHLDVLPSRLVALVDDLEARGLLERRDNPEDRRTYALHLTDAGREVLESIGRVAREHDQALCAALTPEEREQLSRMLLRIAEQQGLTPGVHPGYRSLGRRLRGRPDGDQ